MSKAGVKFSEIREQLMKDEEFKAEYEKLKPRYDFISQIIKARAEQNITQEELALRVGTQKSNINRLESGTYKFEKYRIIQDRLFQFDFDKLIEGIKSEE